MVNEDLLVYLHRNINKEKMIRETLEEAMDINGYHELGTDTIWREGVVFGAKWQEERMYSEQEVLQLLLRLKQTESYDNLYDWFEQNKKK